MLVFSERSGLNFWPKNSRYCVVDPKHGFRLLQTFMEILNFSGKVKVIIIHPLFRFDSFLREEWSNFFAEKQ